MRESSRPKARHTDIVLQEIGDETLVYDLKTNKAICLNQTSSVVWRKCDGTNSITEITEFLGSHMTTEVNEELTNFAIHQLHTHGLLEKDPYRSNFYGDLSRRDVIKKVGATSAIALPIIGAIVAPTAAEAQSGCLTANTAIVTSSAMSEADFDLTCQPLVGQCCNNIVESVCMPFFSGVICDCTCR